MRMSDSISKRRNLSLNAHLPLKEDVQFKKILRFMEFNQLDPSLSTADDQMMIDGREEDLGTVESDANCKQLLSKQRPDVDGAARFSNLNLFIMRNKQPIVGAIIKNHYATFSEFDKNISNTFSRSTTMKAAYCSRQKPSSGQIFMGTLLMFSGLFLGLTSCRQNADHDYSASIRLGTGLSSSFGNYSLVDKDDQHNQQFVAKIVLDAVKQPAAKVLNGTLTSIIVHQPNDPNEGSKINGQRSDSLMPQSTELVASSLATNLLPMALATSDHDTMVAMDSKKKKKMEKKKKKMEKKHKEWKKGKKHKKKKYESKKKKGGMEKKKKGKKMKKKWGEEKKGHKKKGDFKKKKWGHKKKMKKGHKKGKKGHKMLKDKGHKKKGFKKIYHKEEWGKKKKWHDIKREKKWNTKQKKWKKKWHQEKGKKYKGKHMKKYHKKNKHGKKYKKEKKSKWKKHKGEKFKKGHKKKKEEYSKKKEGGKKKKMKKFKKEEKKKKKG